MCCYIIQTNVNWKCRFSAFFYYRIFNVITNFAQSPTGVILSPSIFSNFGSYLSSLDIVLKVIQLLKFKVKHI